MGSNPLSFIDPLGLASRDVEKSCKETCAAKKANPEICLGFKIPFTDYLYVLCKCGPSSEKDPCKGLKRQLRLHQEKLRNYRASPFDHDNQGHLANNPPSRHPQIIASRIKKLLRQIESWKKLVAKCERENAKG